MAIRYPLVMTSVLEELAGGERRSIGRARAVARRVLDDPTQLDEVAAGLLIDDPIVRGRATHVLATVSRTHPQYLAPFKRLLLDEVATIDQWEVRELWCQIMPRLDLDADDVATVRAICLRDLEHKSSIVRACAMQALVDLLRFDPVHADDVRQVIGVLTETGTAAMRARGRKLLKQLDRR